MSWLLVIHVVCAGLWLGCVLVEVTFERVLAGLQTREFLAKLHYWVDLLIELPAFLIVLATGQQMLNSATPTVPLHVMTGAGSIAILANIYCVWLVVRRRSYVVAGDMEGYERADRMQHRVGGVVLLGILIAMAAGIWNVA